MVLSLACPNCGAPLRPETNQALAICLYCGSSIRLGGEASEPPQVDNQLSPEELVQVQRLLGAGKQAEALAFYQQAAGVSAGEAGHAIHSLAKQISTGVILRQQLRPAGFALVGLFTFGLLACLAALVAGWIPRWAAGLLAVLFFSQLYPYLFSLRTELRLRGAKKAPAAILKYAPVGQLRYMHVFRAWVEVRPAGSPPFQAEMDLTVREQNLATVSEGALIEVAYTDGKPPLVVYNGKLE